MIRFVQVEDILGIRNLVLRKGLLKPEECIFPSDKIAGAFHLAYELEGQIVCIASFHPQSYGTNIGQGYQLRGMATLPAHQGAGFGKHLVDFAVHHLKQVPAHYLWCNARKVALGFYERLGFGIVSEEFEVQGIGPHFVMFLNLK